MTESDHVQTFAKTKLPPKTRVIGPGAPITADYVEDRYVFAESALRRIRLLTRDRLNVYTDKNGIALEVRYG